MLLYHGTTESVLPSVRQTGLRPRSQHGGTHNWKHVFAGNPHAVYLTDAYPIIYAVEATDCVIGHTKAPQRLAIIEVDSDLLDKRNMVPDEDMLEQVFRKHDRLPKEWSIKKRSRYYQSRLRANAKVWEDSLKLLGTCAYLGDIPPSAIRRVALINYVEAAQVVMFGLNAVISLAGYRFCADQHKAMTTWIFDNTNDEFGIASMSRNGIEIIQFA